MGGDRILVASSCRTRQDGVVVGGWWLSNSWRVLQFDVTEGGKGGGARGYGGGGGWLSNPSCVVFLASLFNARGGGRGEGGGRGGGAWPPT